MRTSLTACVLAASACIASAQEGPPRGQTFGLGAGYQYIETAHFNSEVCYQGGTTPIGPCVLYHEFRKLQLVGFAERIVGQIGSRNNRIRFEGRIGLGGSIKDNSEDTDATPISDGGFSFAAAATYLIDLSTVDQGRATGIEWYAGAGVDFSHLTANGKLDGTEAFEPWTEQVFAFPLVLGLRWRRGGYRISPEVRVGLYGRTAATWESGEPEQDASPRFFGVMVHVARAR